MRIWQRGALLIALPFLLEAVGLFLMHDALSQSQQALQEERKQVYLLEEINQSFANFVRTSGLIASSVLGNDPNTGAELVESLAATKEHLSAYKALISDNAKMRQLIESIEKEGVAPLETLAKEQQSPGEGFTRLLALKKLRPAVKQAGAANSLCLELIELQKHQHDLAVEQQANSLKRLYSIVYGLAALNGALAILALVIFQSSIGARLSALVEKAKRLPKLNDIGKPLAGRDEFVELDRVLHGAFERLVQAKEFRSSLSSMMVHDLRSPLMALSISTDLLTSSKKAQLNEFATAKIKSMSFNVQRLLRLINEFLEIEKLQSAELTLNREVSQSSALTEEVFETLADLAAFKRIQLVNDGQDLPLFIDRQKTVQVLSNLVANAIKFSPNDSRITVSVQSSPGGFAQFQVNDQGPGLSPALRQKLFTKFAQGDTPSAFKGSGLGLFISKWLIESQGGALGCDSRQGGGSTFWFTVPVENNV